MFSHLARYAGGPMDGKSNTIPSDDPEPPPHLFVAVDFIPQSLKFRRARYERQPDGHYEYDGDCRQ